MSNTEVESRPAIEIAGNSKYEGEWLKNSKVKHGKGKITWVDGSIFEGVFKQGKACENGRMIHATGDVYQGQFLGDKANGFGKYTREDGSSYEGFFKMNKHHGKGTEIVKNDHKYIGEFVDD